MTENYTSERLSEILGQLSKDQLRFVVAMQEYPSKKEAAVAIGISPQITYRWPDIVDEAARLVTIESLNAALAIRRRNLIKAMMVKVSGLDDDDVAVRQKAATEIIEGELGKANQNVDLTSRGEKLESRNDERFDRAISSLADAVRESVSGKGTKQDGEMDTTE